MKKWGRRIYVSVFNWLALFLAKTKPVIGLIPSFMVLATVFVVSRKLANGVVSGKYFWFYLSMGVLAVSTIFTVFFNTKDTMKTPGTQSRNDWMILIFGVVTLTVSYFYNGSEAVTKHIILILVILLYFYFKGAFQMQKAARYWLPVFLIVTGLVEAIWGLRQLYGFTVSQHSMFRLTGSFFNPGPYSCYLAVVLPVAVYYLLRDWNCTNVGFRFRYRAVYLRWGISLAAVVFSLLVLPAGMSRAAWIGALGGCGVVLLFTATGQKFYAKHAKKLLFFVITVFLAGFTGMYFLKKDSADGRAFIWKNAVQTILRHPMGVGIGNFAGSYGDSQAAYFASGKGTKREEYVAGNPEYAFNEYLQICIEQGVFPFILFAGIVGYGLGCALLPARKHISHKRQKGITNDKKTKRKELTAAGGALVALLITAGMSYPFSVLPFLILCVFLLAWIHSNVFFITIDKKHTQKTKRRNKCFVALLSAGLVFACLYNRYPVYNAYRQWENYAFYQSEGLNGATKAFIRLYPYLSDQLTFLFEYAQHLSKEAQYEDSNRVLEKAVRISCDPMLYNVMGKNYQALKQYGLAEECLLKSTKIVPNRVYPYYLLTNLYLAKEDTVKAKETAQLVLTKEPKVQSTAIREMRNEINKLFP